MRNTSPKQERSLDYARDDNAGEFSFREGNNVPHVGMCADLDKASEIAIRIVRNTQYSSARPLFA